MGAGGRRCGGVRVRAMRARGERRWQATRRVGRTSGHGGVCAAGAGVTVGAEDVYVAGADGRALRRGNQRVGRTNLATGERQDERRMAWGKAGEWGIGSVIRCSGG